MTPRMSCALHGLDHRRQILADTHMAYEERIRPRFQTERAENDRIVIRTYWIDMITAERRHDDPRLVDIEHLHEVGRGGTARNADGIGPAQQYLQSSSAAFTEDVGRIPFDMPCFLTEDGEIMDGHDVACSRNGRMIDVRGVHDLWPTNDDRKAGHVVPRRMLHIRMHRALAPFPRRLDEVSNVDIRFHKCAGEVIRISSDTRRCRRAQRRYVDADGHHRCDCGSP